MGKLKEKLLNNLTEDELDDMFGVSSFDYVEYMEKYKKWQQLSLFDDNGDPIPDDVFEQIHNERETAKLEYYDQQAINELLKLKYCDNDIMCILDSIGIPDNMQELIQQKLDSIWIDRVSGNID